MRLHEAAAPFAHLLAAKTPDGDDPAVSGHDDDIDIHGNHSDVEIVEENARDTSKHVRSLETHSRVLGDESNALKSVQHNQFATGEGGDSGSERNRRQRERAARDFMNQLLLIDRQIARLERLIEQNNEQIADLQDQLSVIRQLEALGDNLDPTNPDHARLLREAGIDPSTVDPDNPQAALARRRTEINGEIERLERENEQHQDEIDRLTVERDQLEAQIEQGRALETEIAAAPSAAAVDQIVADASLADTAAALAQTDSDDVARDIHEALDLTEVQSNERLGMEDFASSDDLSFLMDDPPAPISAASEFGEDTPVNNGEGVQPMFERAVAGDVVPPGVEPAIPAPEQHAGTDQTSPDQTVSPT